MDHEELVAQLFKTPSDTGEARGKLIDLWAQWCKEFDEREEEAANKPKSEYEL